MNELNFSYEPPPTDVITIEGIRYSGELFRTFGGISNYKNLLRIVKTEDGIVTIKSYQVDMEKFEAWQEKQETARLERIKAAI